MFQRQFLVILTLSCLMATVAPADQLSPVEALGKDIFFDESLSEPPGQSCATCHGPEAGFAGADTEVNALTAAYPGAVAGGGDKHDIFVQHRIRSLAATDLDADG